MKLVSIIIPAFGSPEYLKECLDAISQQQLNSSYVVEILVGIDNCIDSLEFLKRSKANYSSLRIFYFNRPTGPYLIRNTLATISQADFLLFFDADDIMPPAFLKEVAMSIKPGQMMLLYYKNFIDEPGLDGKTERITDFKRIESSRKKFALKYETNILKHSFLDRLIRALKKKSFIKRIFYVNMVNRLFHKNLYIAGVFGTDRQVFLNLQGYKPWPIAADSEFILRAEIYGIKQIYLSKKYSFLRRVHPESLTLNHAMGMGSDLRNEYHFKRKTSMYQLGKLIICEYFSEIEA